MLTIRKVISSIGLKAVLYLFARLAGLSLTLAISRVTIRHLALPDGLLLCEWTQFVYINGIKGGKDTINHIIMKTMVKPENK